MERYKAFSGWNKPDFETKELCEEYEYLYDIKEQKLICSLTEPEDRTFSRDLEPLVTLLNKLSTKNY